MDKSLWVLGREVLSEAVSATLRVILLMREVMCTATVAQNLEQKTISSEWMEEWEDDVSQEIMVFDSIQCIAT